MSRIGNKPILIPDGVDVTVTGSKVVVKGPKGESQFDMRPEISAIVEDGEVRLQEKRKTKNSSAYWGLCRSLIANMIEGVTEGYEKKLELVGVGYRAKQNGKGISLSVGYSHPVEFTPPEGVEVSLEDERNILVKGISKDLVSLTAAKIRKVRVPEPYKGKGIKYVDEVVRRKPGKAGKI